MFSLILVDREPTKCKASVVKWIFCAISHAAAAARPINTRCHFCFKCESYANNMSWIFFSLPPPLRSLPYTVRGLFYTRVEIWVIVIIYRIVFFLLLSCCLSTTTQLLLIFKKKNGYIISYNIKYLNHCHFSHLNIWHNLKFIWKNWRIKYSHIIYFIRRFW